MLKYRVAFFCLSLLVFFVLLNNPDSLQSNRYLSLNQESNSHRFPNSVESGKNTTVFQGRYGFVEKSEVLSEEELNELLFVNCATDASRISVKIDDGRTLSMQDYKRELALNFTVKYTNASHMMTGPAILRPHQDRKLPNASERLHDPSEKINVRQIEIILKQDKTRRLKMGDDDVLKILEVQEELQNKSFKVPNIVHFIWFGSGQRFKVVHYIGFMGTLRYQKPKVILLHCDAEPVGEYWEVAKMFAGKILRLVRRSAPTEVFDIPITTVQHSADIARLQILQEIGGIYLDLDSVILKRIDEFRVYNLVLAHEDFSSLANGVIFANRNSWFLKRWFYEYRYYKPEEWAMNSCYVPWALSTFFPDHIHVVEDVMLRPSWQEIKFLFQHRYDWRNSFIMHIASRRMKALDGTAERPLKQLAVLNTTYGQIARHAIWGDEAVRDVTNWIVTCNLTDKLMSGYP